MGPKQNRKANSASGAVVHMVSAIGLHAIRQFPRLLGGLVAGLFGKLFFRNRSRGGCPLRVREGGSLTRKGGGPLRVREGGSLTRKGGGSLTRGEGVPYA